MLACCLLRTTSKHTLRVNTHQTYSPYEPTQQAKHKQRSTESLACTVALT
jgi:hypothetical protein